MNGHTVRFAGHQFIARPSGALFWPAQDMLIVADLHLGKSERMARRGGSLLPPFETQETLSRLGAEMALTQPRSVALLGDVYDDDLAAQSLPGAITALLEGIKAGRSWLVLSGNHDRTSGPAEIIVDGIALRHIAEDGPDISGHFHPKARLAGRSRPAFLIGHHHLILPAFGQYTGGLFSDAPVLRALVPHGIAVLTGTRSLAIPVRW